MLKFLNLGKTEDWFVKLDLQIKSFFLKDKKKIQVNGLNM